MKSVKVFAPATIGNIGPGFDVLGLAIKGIGDIVEAREFHGNDLIIEAVLEADHDISTNPDKNTAGIAAQEALKLLGIKTGVSVSTPNTAAHKFHPPSAENSTPAPCARRHPPAPTARGAEA